MNSVMLKHFIFFWPIAYCLMATPLFAQEELEGPWQGTYYPVIQLDTVNIVASTQLVMEDIKRIIKKDNSLIQSFWSMRNYDFFSTSNIEVYDKKNTLVGTKILERKHFFIDSLLYNQTIKERNTGHLYDEKGKPIYFSVEIFENLMQDDTFWIEKAERYKSTEKQRVAEMNKRQKRKYDKKQAKWQEESIDFSIENDENSEESRFKNLPLVDDKLAILEPEMEKYYHFNLKEGYSKYGEESYIFLAIPIKPQRDNTIIKKLEVCIKKSDLSILGYSVDMIYNSLLVDFNIKLNFNLKQINQHYLPVDLFLDAAVDVIMVQEERFVWKAKAYDFELNKDGMKSLKNDF